MRALFVLLGVVAIVAGGAAYYAAYLNAEPLPSFRTATVKRDTLVSTISATGTAEPEDSIDIGSQVTGRIQSFGPDPDNPGKQVNYNTRVDKGTLLATIDPTVYKAQVNQAEAALLHAKADLLQLEAKCVQTKQEWDRAKGLLPKKAIADTDYDLARANYRMAKASVDVGKATIQQCESALDLAKTNLDYTIIRSPFKGVIIKRRVNIGQTVVSAMSASSLFLLAKDLRRMQIWTPVNEADIGRIRPGLPVTYSVETYRGETFKGTVELVRLDGQSTQNVITYTVVVSVENPPTPDYPYGKIKPYMTANVTFEIERHPDVLLVPNAALRWKPRESQKAPDVRKSHPDELVADAKEAGAADNKAPARERGGSPGDRKPSGESGTKPPREKHGHLWIKDGVFVRPVKVTVGVTDGSLTEVSGPDVHADMEVVVGEIRNTGPAEDGGKNLFLPQFPKGGPKGRP